MRIEQAPFSILEITVARDGASYDKSALKGS